ncbi:MAG: 23S rRNA (pseudouridine(1915)-N(3))-methyltransferase RlmH [Polyangiaceae bacterium]
MRVVVAAVGKVKDRPLRDAIDEYLGRIRRYVAIDEIEIADGSLDKVRAGFEKARATRR